jgi:hypothetical protein
VKTRMDNLNLAKLHGLSLVEAIDRLWHQAIELHIPAISNAFAKADRDEQERIKRVIAEAAERGFESASKVSMSQHATPNYEARARKWLKEPQWVCFSPDLRNIRWSIPSLRPSDCAALSRLLIDAVEPLNRGLKDGILIAVGIAESVRSCPELPISPGFFRIGQWSLDRQNSRLVELSQFGGGKKSRGCSDTRLALPSNAPKTQMENGTPPDGATYRTGTQGRPSSWHLVEPEAKRRIKAGEHPEKLNEFAIELDEWRQLKHPNSARMTVKTILNKVRPMWKGRPKNNAQN